jgi:hypothetical protein
VIFRAEAHGTTTHDVELAGVDADSGSVLPPILDRVREDRLESRREKNGWPAGGKWLGNLWDPELEGK